MILIFFYERTTLNSCCLMKVVYRQILNDIYRLLKSILNNCSADSQPKISGNCVLVWLNHLQLKYHDVFRIL